jgi:hypothetical protein
MNDLLRTALLACLALLLAACPPADDDDTADDDDSADPPTLECDDPVADPPPVTSCGFHEGLPLEDIWTSFTDEDGVEVLLVREYLGQGAGHTSIYGTAGFGLVMDGCVLCIDDPTRLTYDTGHHNWAEDAWARLDDVELHLHMEYLNDWSYFIEGVSLDDRETVIWGPIDLVGLDGEILPGESP